VAGHLPEPWTEGTLAGVAHAAGASLLVEATVEVQPLQHELDA
jgi:hypothetical protein